MNNAPATPATPATNGQRSALPPVGRVDAPNLKPVERTLLLFVINDVRQGAHVVWARVKYDKVTDADPRIAGADYLADDEDGKGHLVRIVGAPENRDGDLYLKTQDFSRADGEKPWAWTNLKPRGLLSFELRGVEPGPALEGPAP